jgi:hypothetical protein
MGSSARIDRQRVTLASEAESLYWETKLGATRAAIAKALAEVGDDLPAVEHWLANHHLARERPRATRTEH